MVARKEVDPIFSGNAPHTKIPVGNYMFKVSNRNTKTRCELCPKLTIKTPVFLVFLLLTLSRQMPTGMECMKFFISIDINFCKYL